MAPSRIRLAILTGFLLVGCNIVSVPALADAGTSRTPMVRGVWADLTVQLTPEDARHLLARTGFGVAPLDLMEITGMTRAAAVDVIIDGMSRSPTIPMPAWVDAAVPHYHAREDMDDNTRAIFENERDAELAQLRQWWTANMLHSDSPQTERLVLFWHDLFATSYYDTDRQSQAMARQNQTLRTKGFGAWQDLLMAMIRDPALLEYLDAPSNHKDAPNENLARELMELFTLGEGAYDETLVREAARSLTGHNVSRIHNLDFRLHTWEQDRRDKTLFGVTAAHTGDDLVRLLLEQPQAARFLAQRFWNAYISDAPVDADWLQVVSNRFRLSGYQILTLYRDLLESEAFWSTSNRGMLIKSPIDLLVGTARTLEYPKRQWRNMARWQAALGMELFAPPNVAGWKEGAAFVTPGRLLARYDAIDSLLEPDGEGMSSAVMAGTMMSTGTSSNMMEQIRNARLQVRVAAENYRGAVQYQVSLFDRHSLLWQGEPMDVTTGHDTARQGRISNLSELAWSMHPVPAPAGLLERTKRIELAFINDAASADGDRNLYVDGLQLDERWLSSSMAVQHSECPPAMSADAGSLYCTGRVTFDLRAKRQPADSMLPAWRASAVHVQWADEDVAAGRQIAELTLDNLVTPSRQYHTLQLRIETQASGPTHISLDSFGCWPDCVDPWPECAWTDDNFSRSRVLNFVNLAADDPYWDAPDGEACHYWRLADADKQLLGMLWHNLPALFAAVQKTPRASRFTTVLQIMSARIRTDANVLKHSPYLAPNQILSIDSAFAPPAVPRTVLQVHEPVLEHLPMLTARLADEGLTLSQLLLPDLYIGNIAQPLAEQVDHAALRTLVRHPLFQVK